jgi:two-component system sensor histidine kinase MprB
VDTVTTRRPEGALAHWVSQFSFRTRVTALAAAAVGLAIALAAVTSYFIVSHQLISEQNQSLAKDAGNLEQTLSQETPFLSQNADVLFQRVAERVAANNGDVVQFINSDGSVLIQGASQVPKIPVSKSERAIADAAVNGTQATTYQNTSVDGASYRVLTSPVMGYGVRNANGTESGLAFMVAHSLSQTDQTLAELKLVLLGVGLAGVAVAIVLGLLVARVTIRPVKRLTAAVEHVAVTQDLEARIDEEGDDELARLGHAFNGMLAALAASRTQQAQLISDAGHELRTPLTSLRTNIEVLMRVRDLPDADRAELLGDVQAQLEELTTLIGDVVDMARQEEIQPEPTEVRFDKLVERAVERARRRASSLTFQVTLEAGSIRAQPALLERAVLNVLDNAAKFSPAGRTVEVRLQRGDRWYLDVRDHGPGIDPEDLVRVFDRFYRSASARALPGSGLGLAIVRQVVTSHGGTVAASLPPDGGTVVHIELPIVAEQEPDSRSSVGPREQRALPWAPAPSEIPVTASSDR